MMFINYIRMDRTPANKSTKRTMSVWTYALLSVLVLAGCGDGVGLGVDSSDQDPDPVAVDFPIAYIERPLLLNDEGEPETFDAREPLTFRPGAVLFLKDRASPSASVRDISSTVFEAAMESAPEDSQGYDVKDIDVSFDGSRLLFAMRAPEIENADDDEQPTWNIWEYDVSLKLLRRVIDSDTRAEEGDDVAPAYLPDGRIVFSSTRQRRSKAILLDEGKPQFEALNEGRNDPAVVLHVMESDGTDIEQITFNQSNDLDPVVLTNGKILFTRWDNYSNRSSMNLYQVNPDGSGLEFIYGRHSHDTGSDGTTVQFLKPVELDDGQVMVNLQPYASEDFGGDIVAIDIENFTENEQPTYSNSGDINTAQTSLSFGDVRTDDEISTGGLIYSAYPVRDGTNRLLLSWSQCRLMDTPDPLAEGDDDSQPDLYPCTADRLEGEGYQSALPLYGVWIYDPVELTQLPIVTPKELFMITDAVVMKSSASPAILYNAADITDGSLIDENMGVVHIRSVYDFDGTDVTPAGIQAMADPVQTPADQRPARFLRVIKAVSMADRDVINVPGSAFGVSRGQLMKEILGYVPIEPDGSVKFKVPADVAFTLSIVDQSGQRSSERHQNWMQVKGGETIECLGCHSANSELPHGRYDAQAPTINTGAATTGVPFPNTDPALFTNMGETMAETYARINGLRSLTPDILFEDVWAETNKAADIDYRYADLVTEAPISTRCATEWTGLCRIVVNYEANIHPIWAEDRVVFDTDGITVLANNRCSSCHAPKDDLDAVQIPAAQLDLSDGPSTAQPDHFNSYRELLFGDSEQEIDDDGNLVDIEELVFDENNNPVYLTDNEGNLLLDSLDQPIQQTRRIPVPRAMNPNGARSSGRFFAPFESGSSHEGWLSDAELKLLSEWLDIGAQYYNNPFDVPQN